MVIQLRYRRNKIGTGHQILRWISAGHQLRIKNQIRALLCRFPVSIQDEGTVPLKISHSGVELGDRQPHETGPIPSCGNHH